MICSIFFVLSLMNMFECRPVQNIATMIKSENIYESNERLFFARLNIKQDEIGSKTIGIDLIRKRRNIPCTDPERFVQRSLIDPISQLSNDLDRLTYNEDPQTMLQNMPEVFNAITIFNPCQNDDDFSRWGG